MQEHRGTLVLVLGILSLVLCALLGPFAWIMGSNDLAKMASGTMDPAGQSATRAGMICGIISTILFVAGLFMLFLIFAGFAGIGALGAAVIR